MLLLRSSIILLSRKFQNTITNDLIEFDLNFFAFFFFFGLAGVCLHVGRIERKNFWWLACKEAEREEEGPCYLFVFLIHHINS